MKKLLIVDGNSTLNRAFYGIRPLTTRDGKNTNAVYGMLSILQKQIDALRPDYAAVTFDLPAPTFRKKAYEAYKANRKPAPDELREQFPYAKECLSAMGLSVLELEGYEADDLQGTLAQLAHTAEDVTAYILTGDRDLLQLIDAKIRVLLIGNKETLCYDSDLFFEKYGFPPAGLIEAKALMGDSSDNIPGVAGIGEKTAHKLVAEFATLDGVYEAIDSPSIAKGVREKLLRDRDTAYLSRFLATIDTKAPIDVTLADLAYHGPDRVKMHDVCVKYEFFQLISRLGLESVCDCAAPAADVPTATEADAAAVLALPRERLALSPIDGGIAVATEDTLLLYRGPLSEIAPLFDSKTPLTVYDAKAWYHRLRAEGLRPAVPPYDVMLAAYVDDPAAGHLDEHGLIAAYLGVDPSPEAPTAPYLPALAAHLDKKLTEAGCTHVLTEMELPLVPVLADMETEGFRVDTEGLAAFDKELYAAADLLGNAITEMAGIAFNINSPKQLGEVLFERLALPYPKKKKTGAYSTDADILGAIRHLHPIVDAVLKFRQITKLRSTYAQGLLRAADERGFIHSDFKQAATLTGRLSSAEPNLQNIPIRTELGSRFRKHFVTKGEDYLLIDADYSQIELRLLAHMSGDETMIAAYREGADIHTRTAAAAFRVPESEVTPELRSRAKAVSFGIVYGISAFSLAGDLAISVKDAGDYMEAYFAEFPRVKGYLESAVAGAEETGYTETLFGRRRYIPELTASQYPVRQFGKRVAMNSPIQGTAADIIKRAMIAVHRRLREEGLDAHLILQVHDELIVEAHKKDAERAARILREEMEGAAELSVPLTVEVTEGAAWLTD